MTSRWACNPTIHSQTCGQIGTWHPITAALPSDYHLSFIYGTFQGERGDDPSSGLVQTRMDRLYVAKDKDEALR
jgi:hypothetical protein